MKISEILEEVGKIKIKELITDPDVTRLLSDYGLVDYKSSGVSTATYLNQGEGTGYHRSVKKILRNIQKMTLAEKKDFVKKLIANTSVNSLLPNIFSSSSKPDPIILGICVFSFLLFHVYDRLVEDKLTEIEVIILTCLQEKDFLFDELSDKSKQIALDMGRKSFEEDDFNKSIINLKKMQIIKVIDTETSNIIKFTDKFVS